MGKGRENRRIKRHVYRHDHPDDAGRNRYDVIVVLGARLLRGGAPSPSLRRRVTHGVELFNRGIAGYLLFTGGMGKYPPTEACAMMNLALQAGIPLEKMVLEERSTSTYTNALFTARIMRRKTWKTALVVSDSFHLPRSLMAFRSFGIQAAGSEAAGSKTDYSTMKWWFLHAREFAAMIWYVLLIAKAKMSHLLH